MIPTVTLKNRVKMPMLGLGTWQLQGKTCTDAVRTALRLGYTHFDTAEAYQNESEMREAIHAEKRERLFITSKVFLNHLHHDEVIAACKDSLSRLATPYIDLYLIHWPNRAVDMTETFHALEELHNEGKVRAVGVSNFTVRHLEEAMRVSKVDICVNQVELHPFLHQKMLLSFCEQHNIVVTAYSPLARGQVFKDRTITAIARRHRKTAGQVALRWLHQLGLVVIPKATSEAHLRENMELFDFELTPEEMANIDGLSQRRLISPEFAEFD